MARIAWKSKADTDAEIAQETTQTNNRLTLEEKALKAMEINRTFLRLASPTNAQTLAEVKNLARQNNGIIRLLLKQLDGTD